MNVLKKIAISIWKKPSLYLFVFFIIFTGDRYNRWVNYEKDRFPFVDDVDQFYSYLPAIFIQHDLTFSFPNNYWTVKAPNGNKIARPTYGMALMYSPFFFIGHAIAKSGNYAQDGYSLPYKWSVHAGTFIYAFLGLWFCRKNLLRFFNEIVTLISLVVVFLGTNLFYYTFGWGEMSHSYLFFVLSLFIHFVLKWYDTKNTKYIYVFAFVGGFATLIRPTDIVIMLFPLLLGVSSIDDFKERSKYFGGLKMKLLLAALIFLVPIFIQLLYWKVYSGSWYIFTYGPGERFFFNDPQIINFLFSFRKGWFVYTPAMIFILIGIPFLKKTAPGIFYFMILFFVLNVYILSSWWDWSFGGSFGCRAIIQHYAFFVLALASFISVAFGLFKKIPIVNYAVRGIVCLIFYFLIILNFDQSWMYKYGLIHPSGMTKEAYFYVLNRKSFNEKEAEEIKKLIKLPHEKAMLRGERD